MASQEGIDPDPDGLMNPHPRPRPRGSATSRAARVAAIGGIAGIGSAMDLERFLAVPLITLDGDLLNGRDIVRQRTVLILIDAYRTMPERSAAEVAWVHERLESGIDLVLIWPSRSRDQALAMRTLASTRMYLDSQGAYRRLVSPTGKRVAVLADPESESLERVTGNSQVFTLRRGLDGADERGSDRTIDLGDVYR